MYRRDWGDAYRVVHLCRQLGLGTVRELVERYFAGPALHEEALVLLSLRGLERMALGLMRRVAGGD